MNYIDDSMNTQIPPAKKTGKWVVLVMFLVSLVMAILWWKYVPRTNPREADPGSPYYSPEK